MNEISPSGGNPSHKKMYMAVTVAHACNCSTQKAEVGDCGFEISLDHVKDLFNKPRTGMRGRGGVER